MEVLKQSEWFWTLCSRVITAKWCSKEYGINKIYFNIVHLASLQSFFPMHYNSLLVHLSIFITTIGSNLLTAERLRIVAAARAKANKMDLWMKTIFQCSNICFAFHITCMCTSHMSQFSLRSVLSAKHEITKTKWFHSKKSLWRAKIFWIPMILESLRSVLESGFPENWAR